jgi:hypothetical protein
VGVAVLANARQAKWRQLDLLREFISRWVGQVIVPTPWDAVRSGEARSRTAVENDAQFSLAFKLAPRSLRRRYQEFVQARSLYIEACEKLYQTIAFECETTTGIPVGCRGNIRNWPAKVLTPNFVLSVMERILGTNEGGPQPDSISYDLGSFTYGAEGFTRTGRHLSASYDSRERLELAQADDDSALDSLKRVHSEMMEPGYRRKFELEVVGIARLRENAADLGSTVREGLLRLLAT